MVWWRAPERLFLALRANDIRDYIALGEHGAVAAGKFSLIHPAIGEFDHFVLIFKGIGVSLG